MFFLPYDACDDAGAGTKSDAGVSSFGAAVRHFRLNRVKRREPDDPPDLFEGFYIGLYEFEGVEKGRLDFFDVMRAPPRNRRPSAAEMLTLGDALTGIRETYDAGNRQQFEWGE